MGYPLQAGILDMIIYQIGRPEEPANTLPRWNWKPAFNGWAGLGSSNSSWFPFLNNQPDVSPSPFFHQIPVHSGSKKPFPSAVILSMIASPKKNLESETASTMVVKR
jgi:hypothetical protein